MKTKNRSAPTPRRHTATKLSNLWSGDGLITNPGSASILDPRTSRGDGACRMLKPFMRGTYRQSYERHFFFEGESDQTSTLDSP